MDTIPNKEETIIRIFMPRGTSVFCMVMNSILVSLIQHQNAFSESMSIINAYKNINILRKCSYYFLLQKVRQPFLEAVKITLGDRYTPYMENVYTLTIDFILDGLVEGYMEDSSLPIKLDIGGQETGINGYQENETSCVKAAES